MPDSELDPIVRVLQRLKAQRHYSLQGMAHLLGISVGHLSMLFAGKRRPGLRLVRAAMRRFPEVRAEILAPRDEPPRR
ncbi:MAG: helix-turn-helix transcriptional regulator [Chloroflexi bacterium]|nr:helix-turn-helix transcriptional regulator [Chloroflexota bacterium]